MARDHPRSRGVYPEERAVREANWRIIPARAGFTARRGLLSAMNAGSSPLARGLLHLREQVIVGGRIIPARAGFTPQRGTQPRHGRDHPRSRGVYSQTARYAAGHLGSSPLARGLLAVDEGPVGEGRIIPARAGFTTTTPTTGRRRGDHPRSRGVYTRLGAWKHEADGSSPLARGLQHAALENREGVRIIPARAGFTRSGRLCQAEMRDHPRSRGVYSCHT